MKSFGMKFEKMKEMIREISQADPTRMIKEFVEETIGLIGERSRGRAFAWERVLIRVPSHETYRGAYLG